MKKLYCHIDESGQDTQGRFFLVAAVMVELDREPIIQMLQLLEQETGRIRQKWTKSNIDKQIAYINSVLARPEFQGKLYYAEYADTTDYVQLTRQATTLAIQSHIKKGYSATVYVDGLVEAEIQPFTNYLRQEGHIKVTKVRGATDKGDPIIRLADSLAGFVRDALAGRQPHKQIWERAIRQRHIIEVGKQ